MINRLQRYLDGLRNDPERIVGLVLLFVIIAAIYSTATSPHSGMPHLERKELEAEQQRRQIIEEYEDRGF